jgi:hypothetical protein
MEPGRGSHLYKIWTSNQWKYRWRVVITRGILNHYELGIYYTQSMEGILPILAAETITTTFNPSQKLSLHYK